MIWLRYAAVRFKSSWLMHAANQGCSVLVPSALQPCVLRHSPFRAFHFHLPQGLINGATSIRYHSVNFYKFQFIQPSIFYYGTNP